MISDREAMGLVTDALHQEEGLRGARQHDRHRARFHEELLVLFGQPDDRYLGQLELLHDLERRAQLTLAPIDDDKVGDLSPWRVVGRWG